MKEKIKEILGYSIPAFTLIMYGFTSIMLKYYVNETVGDIYFFWGITGAMIASGNDLSRKTIFWTVLPIISWAYVFVGILLTVEHPKTWVKRLRVIYRRK